MSAQLKYCSSPVCQRVDTTTVYTNRVRAYLSTHPGYTVTGQSQYETTSSQLTCLIDLLFKSLFRSLQRMTKKNTSSVCTP